MKKLTKIKCAVLCLLLLLGTIPFNMVFAEETDDDVSLMCSTISITNS